MMFQLTLAILATTAFTQVDRLVDDKVVATQCFLDGCLPSIRDEDMVEITTQSFVTDRTTIETHLFKKKDSRCYMSNITVSVTPEIEDLVVDFKTIKVFDGKTKKGQSPWRVSATDRKTHIEIPTSKPYKMTAGRTTSILILTRGCLLDRKDWKVNGEFSVEIGNPGSSGYSARIVSTAETKKATELAAFEETLTTLFDRNPQKWAETLTRLQKQDGVSGDEK